MGIGVIGLLLGLAFGQSGDAASWLTPDVTFRPRERAVTDWRWQAVDNLDASPGTRVAILLGHDPATVTRCVRLNNYWCIKRGGWSGEIAADREGHVAFVSAAEGATVAALLLRRYYVDSGRHSALAIVSHWAPASCGAAAIPSRATARGRIGGTLRARWLAAHGHRLAALGRGRMRISAVPDRLIGAALPAPAIALGLDPVPVPLSATLPDGLTARPATSAPPMPACAGDAVRIAHYATRAAAGIAASTTADLGLFDAAGRPTPHLARLMRNMAAVEIGPLGAGEDLVEAAVAHAAAVVTARQAAAASTAPAVAAPGAALARRIDQGRRPEPRP